MNESSLDKKSIWYFGNNRCKNLRLSQPKWDAPFFLTTDYEYAQEYSDYGVYTIILKNENGSKILDFNSSLDVKKLHWPKILIDKIREGKNDLNSIGYDMYILANQTKDELMYIQDTAEWRIAAQFFKQRSSNIFKLAKSNSMWGSERDHELLLQMWKDIYDAGFDGFTHNEFGSKVLALFNLHCIDKISIRPIDKQLNEDIHQFYDIDKNDKIVAKCENPIGKIGISTYDDINAVGIGSFEIFKPYRRMGHAKNVLQKLVKKLKSKYSLVYCFVDKDNYPALSLYRQLGKVSNCLNANGQYEVEFWKKAEDNQSIVSKNIKNLFDEVISQYIALFGIDMSYMKFRVDSQPVYTNGQSCYEYNEDECAGDWTSLGWIRLNPDMKSVMDRYGVAWHGSDDIEEFTKIIIAHELAHEVWNNIASDEFKEIILDEARRKSFSTEYLDTVRHNKLDEETFCEYLAHQIVKPKKIISFPDEEIANLSKQNHIVTHRVSDDANRFNVDDIVIAPWGMTYKVSNKTLIEKVEDSPYIDSLTSQQIAFLDDFDKIAIIELDAIDNHQYVSNQINHNYQSNQLDEEESISNNEVYLSNMAKSFADKAWFLKHIPKDVTTIVDFGGGTGDFAKFCQGKRPDLTYVVIDNNTNFFDQAKSNGFITASSLQNLVANKSIDFNRALLVLSSVIHEIYSYADANEFWQDIKKCRFRAIAIRDMSYDETAMRNAPIDAICWVYENVLMSDKVKYKGIPFREITESFEDAWGKICDPESKKIDGKNIFHFLIKYRYQENWSREVEENYLPISKERLASILASIGYSFKHKESSKLEFYGKCWKKDFKLDIPDNNGYRKQFYDWLLTLDTHIKWFLEKKEQKMDRLDENKVAYLKKYADEKDVDIVVEMFWHIRNRLSAPQNDIDWWIKKPFSDLKSFVQNFDTSNKRQRRDANYKQQAIDNGAKLLDTKDGYEMWYVPTYDAMVAIGRFYKGRSAKWCVASDDPDFWFDNHEDSEFVVLVREHPKNDAFDKVAIEMMNHGRYYNEDDIIPWDLENEDWTFDRGVIDNSEELVHYAWELFKDNGETREQYVG